jgi:hypothetical protein
LAQRFFEAIAPDDAPGARNLPLAMLVRPLPMAAVLVLAINDHLLKGSGYVPGWLTGKLSDFAGLFFFPLLLVSLSNLVGWGLFVLLGKSPLLPFPTRGQLALAIGATGAFFSAVQLHPAVAIFYARASAFLMFWEDAIHVQVTRDPTDLFALAMLFLCWRYGCRRLAQVPPMRLAYIQGQLENLPAGADASSMAEELLEDVRISAAPGLRDEVDALAHALAADASQPETSNPEANAVADVLARLRGF